MTPAPFMARVGAKLLDAVLYGLLLPIPAIVYVRMTHVGTGAAATNIAAILLIVLIAMGFWLLSAAAEARYSRTPGKKMLGLYVVRESGARISFGQAMVRQLPAFLNILFIDALFALFTERHQRAFELLSRTRTVRDA